MNEMLFLMRGNLLSMTTNDRRSGFFNAASLKAGDYYGEELLTWALDPNASSTLPTSTRTVQVVIYVEAFSLTFDDLKFFAAQFRCLHSKQLRHTFSSLGQDLKTSNFVWEILFAIFICIVGLILFSLLIGNMQVPMFEKMDEQLLDALCDHIKPALFTENSFIIREAIQ
ncbi:Cyclic nucleotide-gated ion channel 1 [Capsicum baccatum]|uniref:Cyclic nucleotide-gated ion channel 1 n=1 Tax=Capsicum baccatum TaxID=33114 RepID=A0A2G2X4S6_CAPBA|nr:Cyclic nucleotide-gated ion channel 1 [Capsicum baccatum]